MKDVAMTKPDRLFRKPDRKFDSSISTSGWGVKICADDERRRKKEREASVRLSNVLLSDKILDQKFCDNAWPKIVDQYANLIEENSNKYLQELAALKAYELWYLTSSIWNYEI